MTEARAEHWAMIAILGIVWGAAFMSVAVALEGYPAITVACARTTLGALGLLGLMAILGRKMPKMDSGLFFNIVMIGLLSTAIPFFLLSWGIQLVPSAFAGVSMAAIPLFILPLAHFFSDEKLILRRLIGVMVGFCGALVLIGPGLAKLGQGAEPLAQLACVGAAFCYAASSIFTRRCPPIDPLSLSALALVVGSVALVPLMLIIDGVPTVTLDRPTYAVIFLALIPTAAATLLRIHVIRSAGSVFMTLTNYQVPIWAMVFGSWVLSEQLPFRFYVALALVLTGLAISQWYSLRKLLFKY